MSNFETLIHQNKFVINVHQNPQQYISKPISQVNTPQTNYTSFEKFLPWIILLIVIVLAIIFIFNWESIVGLQQYGQFIQRESHCILKNTNDLQGTKNIISECIPNEISGYGCLNGRKQSYDIIIDHKPCQTVRKHSVWEFLDTGPCSIPEISPDQFISSTTSGTRERRLKCVALDPTANEATTECTFIELQELIGPSGIPGSANLLSVFNIDDIVTITESCADYKNPNCGFWTQIDPETTTDIGPCNFPNRSSLVLIDNCIVDTSDQFNDLKEGYSVDQLGCKVGDEITVPPQNDPQSKVCLPFSPELDQCSDFEVFPDQIANASLPTDFNATSCFYSENPTCIKPCKLDYVTQEVGSTKLNSILDKLLILTLDSDCGQNSAEYFVSPVQTPASDNLVIPFRDVNLSSTANLDVNPLFFIDKELAEEEAQERGCTLDEIIFNTSTLFSLGPRKFLGGDKMESKIGALIDASYQR